MKDMIIKNTDYQKSIPLNTSAKNIFSALTENLHMWWGHISNAKFQDNGAFTVQFENGYWWTFKILEYVTDKELVWRCIDGEPEFNKEWIGHILHWQIEEKAEGTALHFHQTGLNPDLECFDVCSSTWDRLFSVDLIHHLDTLAD